jgi:glyoxylase-like metal-dependent hydrolase (beta-lactamase superfamily II)
MSDAVTLLPNSGWDDRILVCRCGTVVDVYVIVTERFVVLADTLFNPTTAGALLEIARPHLAGGRTLLALNTHADWDHAWGNQLFAGPGAASPAPVIGARRCAARLRSAEARAELARMQAREPERFAGVALAPPTVLFDRWLVIDGGDLTLELFATPGHQPDHTAIFIREIRTLLAGDAAESPFPLVGAPESLPALRASLRRMARLRPRTALYCHAPELPGPALLGANIAYFDELERRCRAALAAGTPPAPGPDADVESLIGWPFAAALPPAADAAALEDFYRPAHRDAIRAMLAWAAGT